MIPEDRAKVREQFFKYYTIKKKKKLLISVLGQSISKVELVGRQRFSNLVTLVDAKRRGESHG